MTDDPRITITWQRIRITVDADVAAAQPFTVVDGGEVNIGLALILLEAQWKKDHP